MVGKRKRRRTKAARAPGLLDHPVAQKLAVDLIEAAVVATVTALARTRPVRRALARARAELER